MLVVTDKLIARNDVVIAGWERRFRAFRRNRRAPCASFLEPRTGISARAGKERARGGSTACDRTGCRNPIDDRRCGPPPPHWAEGECGADRRPADLVGNSSVL